MSTNMGEKAPDRRNNQCKSSDVSTRLESMAAWPENMNLGEKEGNGGDPGNVKPTRPLESQKLCARWGFIRVLSTRII